MCHETRPAGGSIEVVLQAVEGQSTGPYPKGSHRLRGLRELGGGRLSSDIHPKWWAEYFLVETPVCTNWIDMDLAPRCFVSLSQTKWEFAPKHRFRPIECILPEPRCGALVIAGFQSATLAACSGTESLSKSPGARFSFPVDSRRGLRLGCATLNQLKVKIPKHRGDRAGAVVCLGEFTASAPVERNKSERRADAESRGELPRGSKSGKLGAVLSPGRYREKTHNSDPLARIVSAAVIHFPGPNDPTWFVFMWILPKSRSKTFGSPGAFCIIFWTNSRDAMMQVLF